MARKSQFHLPNPTTGAQEIHHFETELAQITDMTSFAQTFNKKSDAASMRSHIGAAANINATNTAAGLMPAADKAKADAVVHSAEAHNGIFRGKDLTSYFNSGQMSTDIANSKFDDIYIGDFITKTINLPAITYTDKAGTEKTQAAQTFANAKFYIAGINSRLKAGDGSGTTVNHVVLISANALQRNVSMNPTNDTTGGYIGSDMWRIHMPNWSAAIKAAFGESHVVKYRDWMSNAINATAPSGAGSGWVGASNGWAWADVEVNIPNEQMIYGGRTFGSGHDCGSFSMQLPLFAHKQYIGGDDRSWFWLRAVASASAFAHADGYGYANAVGASYATAAGGIRPVFLLR
ncbi:MAG: hypothetical protein J6N51_11290 [Selenomonas sp.]|nr:hypothetical protein [Selenomonas sp.]